MKKILLFLPFLAMTLTQAQVSLVKDINPSASSNPKFFIEFNNALYFQAAANAAGNDYELWRTDGTDFGTYIVKDIASSYSSNPRNFKVYNNLLYFQASISVTSVNLYSTDGTESGTTIFQSFSGSNPYFTISNNDLYFVKALSGTRGLFKFDGTSETQLMTASTIQYMISYNSANKIIFQSDGSIPTNWEIWQSDGTPAGTYELADISGSTSTFSDPKFFIEYNGKVYFTAIKSTGGIGRELFVTDGTTAGTVLLKNINPNPSSVGPSPNSDPSNFVIFNNKLYFTANDGTNGAELWMTDGTTAGTEMVLDLYPGATGSLPNNLYVFNNALYFSADHPTLGREIFKCTTLNNITNLRNIAASSASSNPSDFIEYNGKLYFVADNVINGRELWSTTGFSSTTNLVEDIFVGGGSSNPSYLIVFGSNLYFSANDGSTGIELWKYQDPSLSLEEFDNQEFPLYPNPTTNSFTIKTNQTIQNVTLYDIQGKTIKSFEGNFEVYPIEELTPGLYFVNIKTDTGSITKKLIKD